MAKFSVNIKGLEELKRNLKQVPKELRKEVDAELKLGADEIRRLAIRDAPADQGILRSEIVSTKEKDLQHSVFSQALYSGYIEFGTRSNVRIPAGLEQEAARIRADKTQSSLSAKEAIFNWCKRKGIDQRLWYPIYIKIMTRGIKPHPFFFKQVQAVEPGLNKAVANVINADRKL